jgi:hypothetical protein
MADKKTVRAKPKRRTEAKKTLPAKPRASAIFTDPKGLPCFFLLIGKGRKGKSYYSRWLILDRMVNAGWKFGICFTGSAYTGAYDWLPKEAVVDGFSEEKLVQYMNGLKAAMASGKEIPPNFVWLDDCGGIIRANGTSSVMENFWRTARHTNTNVIVCEQYLNTGLPTVLRLQCDYAIMWYHENARTLENLWKEFGGAYEKKEDFVRHFKRCCREQYAAMLYVEREERREDNFLSVKAPAMAEWPTIEAFTW